ncbi:hypothetical protein [Treponema zioleckii]|uniref:hypothetical protein n=1 Tax=Treponema zioleckii TaxID=331680 RepID=UPI00168B60A2|nr:hypothetical protein [Treponema zioleckii]
MQSVKFVNDRTIEYEFTLALGDDYSNIYSVSLFSMKPRDKNGIKWHEGSTTKGKIHFEKDVLDETTIVLKFYDHETFICKHTLVKGVGAGVTEYSEF